MNFYCFVKEKMVSTEKQFEKHENFLSPNWLSNWGRCKPQPIFVRTSFIAKVIMVNGGKLLKLVAGNYPSTVMVTHLLTALTFSSNSFFICVHVCKFLQSKFTQIYMEGFLCPIEFVVCFCCCCCFVCLTGGEGQQERASQSKILKACLYFSPL